MNWRNIQLGDDDLCDQDRIILDLIGKRSVRIYGYAAGFEQFCTIDPHSDFCILFFNQDLWLSEIYDWIQQYLTPDIAYCYVGINRYKVIGDDIIQSPISLLDNQTHGENLVDVISQWIRKQNFQIKQKGTMDQDKGRYFNFIQPLTWIYAQRETNFS